MRGCFQGASAIAFEIDIRSKPPDGATRPQDRDASGHPLALAKNAGEKAWQRYLAEMLPVKPFVLEALTPSEAFAIYVSMKRDAIGNDTDCLDCELFAEATERQKNLVFMENWDDRLATGAEKVFEADLSLEEFREIFSDDPFAAFEDLYRQEYELAAIYARGKLSALEEKMMEGFGKEYPSMIARRNVLWVPKILKAMESAPTFFVVGAGHMGGPDSLEKLLKAQGVTVTRVVTCDW